MNWQDEGIVLSARPHGETSAIAELFTRLHGRYLGLIRGGRSRRVRPVLQPGNVVRAEWRARLPEHLGAYTIELADAKAAAVLDDKAGLAALNALTAMARLLPERDPHEKFYGTTLVVLDHLTDIEVWPALLVRWELALLDELGFGLDLQQCAVSGESGGLVYVSPKSGRAVSQGAGAPYKKKLLALPAFLMNGDKPGLQDIADGFALTGYFLDKHVFGPRGIALPEARGRMLGALADRMPPGPAPLAAAKA